MYEPEVGCRHDMLLYAEFEAKKFLSVALQLDEEQFVVYGNS